MSVITILGLLLFILMVIFGGKKGVISYLTLFLNFVILLRPEQHFMQQSLPLYV